MQEDRTGVAEGPRNALCQLNYLMSDVNLELCEMQTEQH